MRSATTTIVLAPGRLGRSSAAPIHGIIATRLPDRIHRISEIYPVSHKY